MKVAQIVITRTKHGQWKVAMMSLQHTEEVWYYDDMDEAAFAIAVEMGANRWEELTE